MRASSSEWSAIAKATEEQLWHSAFEDSSLGQAITAPDGVILRVNTAFCTLLEVTREELDGRALRAFTHSDDVDRSAALAEELLTGARDDATSDTRYVTKTGRILWAHVMTRLHRSLDGQPSCFFTQLEDVTDRMKAQADAQACAYLYHQLRNGMMDAFLEIDLSGRILAQNQAFCELVGYPAAALTNLTQADLTPSRWHATDEAALTEQVLVRGHSDQYEKELLRRDGTTVPVEVRASLLRDQRGQAVGAFAIIRDITTRRLAAEALLRAAQEWRTTFDAIEDPVWLLDRELHVVRSNRASVRLLGQPSPIWHGDHCWEIVYGALTPPVESAAHRVRLSRRRESANLEFQGRRYDVTVDPIVNGNGDFAGAVHVMVDVTERWAAQRELESSRRRLEAAQRVARLGAWRLDLSTRETVWSDTLYDLYARDPAAGPPIEAQALAYHTPEEAARLRDHGDRALVDGQPWEDDLSIRHPNGRKIHVAVRGEVVFGPDGLPTGLTGTVQDITERVQAARLLEARVKLVALADHPIGELGTRALDIVGELTDSPIGFFHLVDPGQQMLSLLAWSTRTLAEFCKAGGAGSHYPVAAAGIWADALRQKEPVIHNDYPSLPNRRGLPEGHAAVLRELVLPVVREGVVVAILGVGNKPTEYTQRDVAIVQHLADVTWDVVEHRRATLQAAALLQATRTVVHEPDRDRATRSILDVCRESLQAGAGSVALMCESGTQHEALVVTPERDLTGSPELGPSVWPVTVLEHRAYEAREPVVDNAVVEWGSTAQFEGRVSAVSNVLLVPLWVDDALVGQMALVNKPGGFTTADARLSAAFGELVAVVVQRHRAEASLRSRSQMLRAISDAAQDGIIVIDDSGAVSHWNPAAERLLGYTYAEAVGRNLHSLIAPERHLAAHHAAFPHFRATGEGSVVGRTLELTALTKARAEIPVELSLSATSLDGRWSAIGILRDISARKRAEAELLLLHLAVEQSPASVVITDSEGKIEYVNQKFCDVTGYTFEEVQGKNPRVLKSGATPADTYQQLWQTVSAGATWSGQFCNCRKDGSEFWEQVSISPVRGKGESRTSHYVALKEDITARRALELQLHQSQKLEAVGQLAAGIAHEINTPTQFVSDSVHFIDEALRDLLSLTNVYRAALAPLANDAAHTASLAEVAAAEERADLDYLRENGARAVSLSIDGLSRIARIVRAMKEFSHPDQGQKVATDLNAALQTTLVIAANEYKYVAEAICELQPLPTIPCLLGEMNQVFLVLIVNAAHAIADVVGTTGEKGKITIRTAVVEGGVEVSISDTGGGIPEAIRHRVGEPFFTTKAVGRGTGQGLAIARSIVVKKHDGRLTFTSEEGLGTRFVIWLPFGTSTG